MPLYDLLDRAGRGPKPDIYVVGTGVRKPGQVTQEGIEALRRCRAIYGLMPPGESLWYLGNPAPRFESLWHLYEPGRLRRQIYDAVITAVLDAAARERPLGYLTLGNPVLFDDISRGIVLGGRERGLRVQLFPGVSAIDTVLADLNHDIAGTGLQVFGASWFVLYRIEPRVDVPCLLLQPAAFGTSYATLRHEPRPATFAPLRDHLLRFYPPEHELLFVRSAGAWFEQAQLHRLPMRDLVTVGNREIANASLFIPRLREPDPDPSFGAKMYACDHFTEAYRSLD